VSVTEAGPLPFTLTLAFLIASVSSLAQGISSCRYDTTMICCVKMAFQKFSKFGKQMFYMLYVML